ncbi:acyl carrier protein, partial [Ruminococcus champanellensis]
MDEKLTELLRSMSRYEDAEVTPDASFGADLGMNSFDFLQLLYAVEMTFAKHICL